MVENKTMTYLTTVDPGLSTGVAFGWFNKDNPYQLLETYQIEGGCQHFIKWWRKKFYYPLNSVMVVEKFVLSSGNEFVANLVGVPIEGFLMGLCDDIVWQYRAQKSTVSDQTLKDNGLWLRGKDVGCEDARDANDALLHALIYLRTIRHKPSMKQFYGGNTE
jgi:hypothetical protein